MGIITRLWKWNAQALQACQVVLNGVYQWDCKYHMKVLVWL